LDACLTDSIIEVEAEQRNLNGRESLVIIDVILHNDLQNDENESFKVEMRQQEWIKMSHHIETLHHIGSDQ